MTKRVYKRIAIALFVSVVQLNSANAFSFDSIRGSATGSYCVSMDGRNTPLTFSSSVCPNGYRWVGLFTK
ncbi:hypothetical protein AHAT_14380 [Agarivorans sp. Toyoura001]|nr:hypothetical protein AHAT_14380 [Agarivorans sp. Toyoura001]